MRRRDFDARGADDLEGEHDQRVAGEHREALAVGGVHRRLAAPQRRVVEAGQVVVDERAQCSSSIAAAAASETPGRRRRRPARPRCTGADGCARRREHRVPHRRREPGGASTAPSAGLCCRAASIRFITSIAGSRAAPSRGSRVSRVTWHYVPHASSRIDICAPDVNPRVTRGPAADARSPRRRRRRRDRRTSPRQRCRRTTAARHGARARRAPAASCARWTRAASPSTPADGVHDAALGSRRCSPGRSAHRSATRCTCGRRRCSRATPGPMAHASTCTRLDARGRCDRRLRRRRRGTPLPPLLRPQPAASSRRSRHRTCARRG